MATPIDSKQIIPYLLRTPNVSGGRPGSPYKIACGEKEIYQGGVLGDGEGSESGDEKR